MNPVAQASLADYAFKCCQDLKQDCQKVQNARRAEFRAKSVSERVGFYTGQIFQYGGMGVAVASLAVGTLFSLKFFLVAAVAGVVFLVGVIAKSIFGTISPIEEALVQSLNNPDPLGLRMHAIRRRFNKPPAGIHAENKDNLPKAEELQAARALFIDDVAKTTKKNLALDVLTRQNTFNTYIFIDFFGGKGLSDKLKSNKPLTPEESVQKEHVAEKLHQVKVVYATTLLLETIQHVVNGQYVQARANAAAVQAMEGNEFPAELKQKVTLLTDKMKEPNKLLQDKIVKAVGPKFQMSDLDTVYAALAG